MTNKSDVEMSGTMQSQVDLDRDIQVSTLKL